jgi:hypothetical protein
MIFHATASRTCFFAKYFLSITIILAVFSAQAQSLAKEGYAKASYRTSQAGQFMQTWLVAGPVSVSRDSAQPTETAQEAVFKADEKNLLVSPGKALAAGQREYQWQVLSLGEDIVNLDSFYKKKDFAYAYAMAEIQSPTATGAILALGSDDGIKVWHNGKLVHENWIPRTKRR